MSKYLLVVPTSDGKVSEIGVFETADQAQWHLDTLTKLLITDPITPMIRQPFIIAQGDT